MTRSTTPNATELFPIVSTPDVERALGFYRDSLGGVVTFSYPGSDGEPVYVALDLGSSHLPTRSACGCTRTTATRWSSASAQPVAPSPKSRPINRGVSASLVSSIRTATR